MPVYQPQTTLNAKDRLIDLSQPIVMGILNVTADSFYDGGRFDVPEKAVAHAGQMLEEGAAIIDIGGMSSRPGAELSDPEEEADRVLPVIESILQKHPDAILSIDTIHASVARRAVNAGVRIINDISAGEHDPHMLETAVASKVPFVAMHMQGKPMDMQESPEYEDVALDVLDYFIKKVRICREAGITDVIIDPGLGFGKTLDQNYELLRKVEVFHMLEVPILIGCSRKSMIYKLLETDATNALNGTTAVHMYALTKGANILRAHDVKEAVECIRIYQKL